MALEFPLGVAGKLGDLAIDAKSIRGLSLCGGQSDGRSLGVAWSPLAIFEIDLGTKKAAKPILDAARAGKFSLTLRTGDKIDYGWCDVLTSSTGRHLILASYRPYKRRAGHAAKRAARLGSSQE